MILCIKYKGHTLEACYINVLVCEYGLCMFVKTIPFFFPNNRNFGFHFYIFIYPVTFILSSSYNYVPSVF